MTKYILGNVLYYKNILFVHKMEYDIAHNKILQQQILPLVNSLKFAQLCRLTALP